MEDTLRGQKAIEETFNRVGLNPCFNGRYSQRMSGMAGIVTSCTVLILVLMEDTLRDRYFPYEIQKGSLS